MIRLNYSGFKFLCTAVTMLSIFAGQPCFGQSVWEANSHCMKNIFSVASHNGRIVAAGSYGTILTSADGMVWDSTTIGDPQSHLLNVAWVKDRFIATSNQCEIHTSPDGLKWTTVDTGQNGSLCAVTYGNSRYVAVGCYGMLYTSPDAVSWTFTALDSSFYFLDVVYVDSQFVGVGDDGFIGTSRDGITWRKRQSGVKPYLLSIAYGNGRFVAVGLKGTMLTSTDGTAWSAVKTLTGDDFYSVRFGNNRFVAAGGDGFGFVTTSSDGLTWTETSLVPSVYRPEMAYDGNRFILIGMGGISGGIAVSDDGENWSDYQLYTQSTLLSVAFGNHRFAAVGMQGTIITSDSSKKFWTVRKSGTSRTLSSITFGNNRFVAIGDSGTIISSTDGCEWVVQDRVPGELAALTFGSGRFVILKHDGSILRSADGATWESIKPDTTYTYMTSIASGNDRIIAVQSSRLLFVEDENVWSRPAIFPNVMFPGPIAYGNNRFVMVGYRLEVICAGCPAQTTIRRGVGLVSTDGTSWTVIDSGAPTTSVLTYAGRWFIGINGNRISLSADGASWTYWPIPNTGGYVGPASATFGDDRFVAVGEKGLIMTSRLDSIATKTANGPGTGRVKGIIHALVNRTLSVTLPSGTSWRQVRVAIFEPSGKRICSAMMHAEDGQLRVPVSKLPHGCYIAVISGTRGTPLAVSFVITRQR